MNSTGVWIIKEYVFLKGSTKGELCEMNVLVSTLTGTNETFHRVGKQDEYKWYELFISPLQCSLKSTS